MKDRIFMFICLLIPLLFLAPGMNSFIYASSSAYSDLTISHYPNLIYLKDSLAEWGIIPFWSNTILSGYPFAADPLSGLWYPFNWLLLVLPQPFGFNLVIAIHIFLGGLGIYFALEKSGIQKFSAILGAVTFELMPKLIAHFAAGHISLVYAVCLTPWIIYAEKCYRDKQTIFWRFASGLILGFIALADMRWIPYSGILFVIMRIANISKYISIINISSNKKGRILPLLNCLFSNIFLPLFITAGISAVVWLPLLQYSYLSTRSLMTVADRLDYSMPPEHLLGILYPDMQGYWEWMIYPGALAFLSLVIQIFSGKDWKKTGLWIGIVIVSLLWALGAYNPLMQFISALPGFSLLRVPPRVMFMAGIAFAMLTGFFTHSLFSAQPIGKYGKLAVMFICVLAASLCLGLKFISHDWNIEFLWGAAFPVFFAILLLVFSGKKPFPVPAIFVCLFALLILDLGTVTATNVNFRSKESVSGEKAVLAKWLSEQPGQFRVYSAGYSVPQLTAVNFGLELADGIDPMQLQSYDNFLQKASGVPGTQYTVKQPRSPSEDLDIKEREKYVPSAQLLGLLNVRYICSEFPMEVDGLKYVDTIENTLVYENQFARQRVWVQKTHTLSADPNNLISEQSSIQKYEPNKIVIDSNGQGGVLVLSEMDYPGWKVFVDGEPSELISVGDLLRGVQISSGEHEIKFIFRPFTVYCGIGISVLSLLVIGIVIAIRNQSAGKDV